MYAVVHTAHPYQEVPILFDHACLLVRSIEQFTSLWQPLTAACTMHIQVLCWMNIAGGSTQAFTYSKLNFSVKNGISRGLKPVFSGHIQVLLLADQTKSILILF